MTPHEYLQRYLDARNEALEIEYRIEALVKQYAMPSAIEYSDMPKAQNAEHDLSDYIVKLEELTQELHKKREECLGIMSDINDRVETMEDATERTVLRYRYIHGMKIETIADVMHMTERNVYYIRDKALQHFPL